MEGSTSTENTPEISVLYHNLFTGLVTERWSDEMDQMKLRFRFIIGNDVGEPISYLDTINVLRDESNLFDPVFGLPITIQVSSGGVDFADFCKLVQG